MTTAPTSPVRETSSKPPVHSGYTMSPMSMAQLKQVTQDVKPAPAKTQGAAGGKQKPAKKCMEVVGRCLRSAVVEW